MACISLQAMIFPYNLLAVAISIFISILVALYLYKQSQKSQQCLLFIMITSCIAISQTNRQLQLQIPHQYISSHQLVNICATITDMHHLDNNRYHYKIMIKTSAISLKEDPSWQSCHHTIALYCVKNPTLRIGDEIIIHSIPLKIPPAQQSYALYLLKEGISATSFVYHLEYSLINRPIYHVQRFFYEWRESIYTNIEQKMSPLCFALYSSLFLGNRHEQKRALEPMSQKFQHWGIVHHLARSGLHLILFAASLLFLLKYTPLSLTTKKFCMLTMCSFYYCLSWSSLPFLRSFVAFALNSLCCFLTVQINTRYLITLICFIMLLLNPIQLFFLDFQLTFLITYAIAWFNYCYPSYRYINHSNYCSI
jgi:predicted membrane metal-binding protein